MEFLSLLSIFACYATITHARGLRRRATVACPLSMTSANEGYVTSPGYPSSYPMSKCLTTISAPAGKQVSLVLLYINTPGSSTTCNRNSDRIFVHDKPASRYVRARTWCGSTIPSDSTFTSTKNIIRIKFKPHKVDASYQNTYSGFNISVSFIDSVTTTTTTTTTTSTTTISSSITTTSSGASCGISNVQNAGSMLARSPLIPNPLIVGGTRAANYQFPWLVVLYKPSSGFPFCGGAILNKRWIITAAHCVDQYRTNLGGMRAMVHVRNVHTRAGAQTFTIAQIIVHNNFQLSTFNNDIGLIKLNQDIVYSDETQPVCLPEAGNLYINRESVIAGWGTTISGSVVQSTYANFAMTTVTSNAQCNNMMAASINNPLNVNANMVCVTDNQGNTQRDTCQGDSGGPMTVQEADDRFHIVGITSWGYGCASGTPGVYTRVTRYLGWIQSRINN